MSIQNDFDRIALTEVSTDGANHNDYYHNFLLSHLPTDCQNVLEIGCGTGSFARRLAEHCGAENANERGPLDRSAGSAGAPPAGVAGRSGQRGPHDRGAGSANEGHFEHANAGSAGILPAGLAGSAARVQLLALDFSPEMIRLARARSAAFPNITFELADVCERSFDVASFDCIASIATLHHLPYAEMLAKMKAALKPGGVLLILDLFEPARISDSPLSGFTDSLLNLVAIPVSVGLRLIHHRRLLPRREERDAWKAHEQHDLYPTMREVRAVCASLLPGAKIKQHLLWRYSIVWQKPA